MKQAVTFSIVGVLVFILCLLVTVPAAWVWHYLPNKPKQVQLNDIHGSIWDGRIGHARIAGRDLEQLQWQLHPSALLSGNLAASIKIDGAMVNGKGEVRYGLGGLQAEGLRLQAPLGWLVGQQRLPFRTKLAGGLTLNVRALEQGQPWCDQLQGRLLLTQLDVNNQFGAYPLGDIAAGLSCQQGQVVVKLDKNENRIGVEGQMTLMANNQVKVDGSIAETRDQPKTLQQALSFIGKPDANGAYPLTYQGTIPGL